MSQSETIIEMIKSRTYLLDFQKRELMEDLEDISTDNESIEKIMDDILYKLFGKGWNALTGLEKQDIFDAWKGE